MTPDGELGLGQFLAGGGVEQVQHAEAVFVGDEARWSCRRGRAAKLADVPLDVVGEEVCSSAGEVDVGEAVELGVAVGGDVDRLCRPRLNWPSP